MSVAKHSLLLRLLGKPALFANDGEIVLPEKAYPLLAFVAASSQFSMERETLRGMLWQSDV